MKKLEDKFSSKGIVQPSGKWIVFPRDIAIDFIKECQKENNTILGIDGFFIEGVSIRPSMANSINFSNSGSVPEGITRYEASIAFLESQDKSIYFEIVYEESR